MQDQVASKDMSSRPRPTYGIVDITSVLGASVVDNVAQAGQFGFDPEFVAQKIGVRTRHVAADDESTASLAIRAVGALLDTGQVAADTVEVLCTVTQTPDDLLPNTSSVVHGELGLNKRCAAFDMNLGCSGYVYALDTMAALMERNAWSSGLLVTSETYSRLIDPGDRATGPLFSDAATATLLTSQPVYAIGRTSYYSDGRRRGALTARGSGTSLADGAPLYMDGREVFSFVMGSISNEVNQCLEQNDLALDDIDTFVFHQASRYMLEATCKRLSILPERFIIDLEEIGNTTASSIPLALERNVLGRENRPRTIILSGFGVGLSCATTILRLQDGDG